MTIKQEVNKGHWTWTNTIKIRDQTESEYYMKCIRINRKWTLNRNWTHTIRIIWQKHIPWWGARFRAKLTICFLLFSEDHHSSIVLCCAHPCCEVQHCWAVRRIDSGLIATCNGDVDSWWVTSWRNIDLNKTHMSCSVHVLYSWGNTVTLNANWPTWAVGWSSTQCLLILWTRSSSL